MAAVVADRVTESVAVSKLAGHPVHVVGPLWLKLSYNTGAAFGVAQGWSTELAVIAVALIAVLIFVGRSTSKNLGLVAVGLMLGGAIGNLSDRLFGNASGAVVDFIYTRFWPTFNVADACIVIGGALLVITMGRSKKTH